MESVLQWSDVSIILHLKRNLTHDEPRRGKGSFDRMSTASAGQRGCRTVARRLGMRSRAIPAGVARPESAGATGRGRWVRGVLGWVVFLVACSPAPPPHPKLEDPGEGFSARLVHAHVDALMGLQPRWPDSSNDAVARAYLTREFRLAGAETEEWYDGDRRHLVATLPGDTEDGLLLVAAYPVLDAAGWIDDSGAAFLLELARIFGTGPPPPYTLRFALAETRPRRLVSGPGSDSKNAQGDPVWLLVRGFATARDRISDAGRSLAAATSAQGRMDRLRAVITFDWTAHPGLRIARDLRSQPTFRQIFWNSASALGRSATFPSDGRWASPESLHLGFRERSMDRVLALVDEVAAGANPLVTRPRGVFSEDAIDSVGDVTVEALVRLMRRFEKIDAFSR